MGPWVAGAGGGAKDEPGSNCRPLAVVSRRGAGARPAPLAGHPARTVTPPTAQRHPPSDDATVTDCQ